MTTVALMNKDSARISHIAHRLGEENGRWHMCAQGLTITKTVWLLSGCYLSYSYGHILDTPSQDAQRAQCLARAQGCAIALKIPVCSWQPHSQAIGETAWELVSSNCKQM